MGKAPAFQFYPGDWSRDLEEHPLRIEGAWIRICCKLWWSETRGKLTKSLVQWSRILRTPEDTTLDILTYIKTEKIGEISLDLTEPNKNITVVSRRMLREEKERESNRLRQERYYKKKKSNAQPNKKLTSPSSTSSSYIKKERKKEGKKILFDKTQFYPPWLDLKLWNDYKEHRKQLKCKMTQKAEELAIKKLQRFIDAGEDQQTIIEQSIERGWKGLFSAKKEGSGQTENNVQVKAFKPPELTGDEIPFNEFKENSK